jgi:hypothetical protein
MSLIPQERTLSLEVAHGIAKRVALPPLPQGLHKALKHPARLRRVGRLPPTPGFIAPRVRLLVRNIQVVARSFPLSSRVTQLLPNKSNDPLKEIHPDRLPTYLWLLLFLTPRSAEMSMVMAICLLSRQTLNPLFLPPNLPPHLISHLPYK